MPNKWILSVGLMLTASLVQAQERALEDIIDDVNSSVVSIVADTDDVQALGAGIIVEADGYIVTNAHVTENATKIMVVTADDSEYEAELVGADVKTDVALIRVMHPNGFEPAQFADSDDVRVGNAVFAIGNPFGLGNSVSSGIISAKERDIEKGQYDNFLQTDASINQGNSGGPLFNMNGEIVGMNTAIFSTDGQDIGVGFATPANQVKWVVSQIKQNGKVVRGWLGIGVQKIRSTDEAKKNKLIVASMAENSPASNAGIQVGDIIEDAGGLSLQSPRHFSLGVAQSAPGTILPLIVLRDGKKLDLELTVAEMPEDNKKEIMSDNENKLTEEEQIKILERLGLDQEKIKKATDFPELHIKAYFDEIDRDFLITQVEKDSDAARKGVEIGNRFSSVDGKKIFGIEDLKIKLKQARKKGKVELQLMSADTIDTVIINLEP